MALTRITKGVIKPNENYDTHNINSTGIVTATGANITGNLTVGGVLTYEDVTSIDSVGIITAQKGIHVGAGISAVGVITASSFRGDGSQLTGIDATSLKDSGGNVKIQAQASGAMHTGIHTFSSGAEVGSNIKLGNAGVITATSFVGSGAALTGIDATAVKDSGGNVKIQAQASGAVYTGIHTFITLKSTSGTFTGDIDVDGHTNLDNVSIAGVTTTTDNINIDADNKKLQIGASQDLQLFHDGGHSRITNTTGILKLTAPAGQSVRVVPPDDSGNVAVFHIDGSTHLYYDSAHKFSTVSDGIEVVGNMSIMDSIYHRSDDNTKIRFPANDTVTVETSGGERLRINSTGQIITNGGSANPFPTRSATFQPASGQTNCYISIVAGNSSSVSGLTFGDDADNQPGNYAGMFEYRHNIDVLAYMKYGVDKILIDRSGNVNITGIVTTTGADINGDLDVDGHTNLDNVSIAGVTTMSGNATFGSSGSITSAANFNLSSNGLVIVGSQTVIEAKKAGNATIQCTDTSNSTDLQLRANSEGGLVRTATNYPLILGAFQREKLRIDGGSYARIGINTSTFDTAGSQLKIEGRGTGTTSPPYLQIKGVGNGNLHSYVDLIATSDSNAGSAYRGLGIVMHDEPTNVEWFSGRPYAGSDKFIIGRKASPSYRTQSGEVANSFFQITSTGQLLQGETSTVDSNTAIQFRKDVTGNQARFIFRNRGNNDNSRVQIQAMTLNRAANADVFSGIEKYQSGGMSIYNGENTNQHSGMNFFCNGWRSLQLRNGNHSGHWCAEIDAYWGTSNGLRMEVGGPQSGTWQAIDFHTSHTGTQRGYIGVTYGGVSYNSSSDYRMKQDVVDMTGAIDRIKLFLPKRFKWKEDPTHTVDGFLAHEAATVVPESVQGEKDGEQMQVMDNSKLVPVLTAALKEAIAKIEILEAKVAALESS